MAKSKWTQWHVEYERSFEGFLRKRYWNMKRRVKGTAGPRPKGSYLGVPLMEMEDFLEWGRAHPEYARLYYSWVESGRARSLTPTVDRIKRELGYVLGNIQWLTMSDNTRKGALQERESKNHFRGVYRNRQSKKKQWIACISINKKSTYLGSFLTAKEAAICYDRMARTIYGSMAKLNFP